jgi:hypothetical protein
MGRKYYYPKKSKYRSSGGGGLAGMIFSALAGRRSHGHYRPRSSLKSSLVNALVKAVLKKIFR